MQDGDKVGSWQERRGELKEGALLMLCVVYDIRHN